MKKSVNWPFYLAATALVLGVLQLSNCKSAWVFPSAHAGEGAITWTAPTTNCDGTALTDLAKYDMTYGTKRVDLPLTPLAYTVTGLTPGTWWFSLAATTTGGVRSEFVTVEKTIAPTDFVTKTNKVYTFLRSKGNITLTVTPHTVPLGVVCDATQSVNGKFKVPLEAVTWSGTKLTAALADCG
jgi:hypothetical protein